MRNLHEKCFAFVFVTILVTLTCLEEQSLKVCGLELNPSWFKCSIEHTNKEAKIKAFTDCEVKQNYKLPPLDSLEAIKEEMKRLSSNDFDDSCFSKCYYETINLSKDGKISATALDVYFKSSNITDPLLMEYKKLFEECIKETEPKFKDAKETPCKMYTMVDFCLFEKFDANKQHLEEICNTNTR